MLRVQRNDMRKLQRRYSVKLAAADGGMIVCKVDVKSRR